MGAVQLHSRHQMADQIDAAMLDLLRERGVTRATFHADGTLATVEFGTLSDERDQRDEPPTPKRRSATGGLVPRRVESDS